MQVSLLSPCVYMKSKLTCASCILLPRAHPAHHGAGAAETGRPVKAEQGRRRGGLGLRRLPPGRPPDTAAGAIMIWCRAPTASVNAAKLVLQHYQNHVLLCFCTDGGAPDV